MITRVMFNRSPLTANFMAALPLGAVKPEGWLKEQLESAAKGLTGKLHSLWADIRDSAWRGGQGDDWERAPYYLDGLVPLAYLLEDKELIGVCREFIEWTLASQREDGFFGPQSNTDWWPRMVMLKALIQYYTASGDKRVPEFMFNYFKYQYKMLEQQPLKEWAVARAAENMQAVVWLYNLTGAKFLLKLMRRLHEQALDWTAHFYSFPHTQPMSRMIPWEEMKHGKAAEQVGLTGFERPYYGTQYHLSHVVNVAMGLKMPGVVNQFKSGRKETEGFRVGWEKLMKYHGLAYGIFSGDEHINGNSPVQGTELCAIVELMHTCEVLLTTGISPDGLGDILEKLAFNALPGALSADMMTHVYDQQPNQISATQAKRSWYNNDDRANVYDVKKCCCTANLHQGWPKYAASLWYAAADEGFAAVSYAPCTVRFLSGGVPVRLTVEGEYPFGQTVRIKVEVKEPKKVPLHLRIPEWAAGASVCVNDEEAVEACAGKYFRVEREWQGGEVIVLNLPMQPRVTRWGRKTAAVEVGALLMAFRPEETWTRVSEKTELPEWSVTTKKPWNWALVKGGLLELNIKKAKGAPFGTEHGITVKAEAVRVPEWKKNGASCAQTIIEPIVSGENTREIELIPYGDTALRIAQFPYAARSES